VTDWACLITNITTMNIDQKLIKRSKFRSVLSGSMLETFEYQEPYLYNFPPSSRTREGSRLVKDKRRDDNVRTMQTRIRRLVETNVHAWGELPKFLTLTFKKNVKTIESANIKFRKFNRKMQYITNRKLKYLSVIEFQKRGAIHYHTIYFNLPYKKNIFEILEKAWGVGYTNLKKIDKVKNTGAYVCKYLQKENMDRRLVGKKAYMTSRGLLKPIEWKHQETFDKNIDNGKIDKVFEKVFDTSKYGKVIYKQFKIYSL